MTLIFLGACRSTGDQSTAGRTIPLQTCSLSGGVEAKCGSLTVAENPELAGSRNLDLNIAVIPAASSFPEPDPLFMLAGGPGQAAAEAFAPYVTLLEDLNKTRDIVLVDQRGTGDSSPLECPRALSGEEDIDLSDEEIVERFHACAAEIAETADLTQYGTDRWAADLDAVREALGYEKINLYGVSYGTRAAQAYTRLFPQHVRTIALDAVTGPELILFLQMPRDGQRSLELLFERCETDQVCKSTYPDFAAEYEALLARLESQSQVVTLTHPRTGKEVKYTLTSERLSNAVYALLYSTDLVSLLPLVVHEAFENGDYGPLVSQGILIGEGAGMNLGLLYAVTCSEDAPLIDINEASEIQEETSFALRAQFFLDVCQAFPKAEIAEDFRQPLVSNIPVLLLSGDADPVTPPLYADQVAQNLTNSLHIVVPHYGHGLLGEGCMPKIFDQFISAGSLAELDTGCLDDLRPPPFFVDFNGPEA